MLFCLLPIYYLLFILSACCILDELTHSKLKVKLLQVSLQTYKTRNQQKLV